MKLSGRHSGRACESTAPDRIMVITMVRLLQSTKLETSSPEPGLLVFPLGAKMICNRKGNMKSDIGITPSNDGKDIRLVFPN